MQSRRRGGPGKPSFLTKEQERQVVAEAATGAFATAAAVRDWIEARFGVVYTRDSMYTLLKRLGLRLKTPRPQHPQAAPRPGRSGKGGLAARLAEAGLTAGAGVVWDDEMRVGLRGRVCRLWAPRGTAVLQDVQMGWKYTYVAVAIDPLTSRLWWAWQANMKGAEMARIRGEDMQAVDAPEPDPVERVFRELRRAIKGRVYPDLQAKQETLEAVLNAWQADPERMKRLCGWNWIQKALKDLPGRVDHPRIVVLDSAGIHRAGRSGRPVGNWRNAAFSCGSCRPRPRTERHRAHFPHGRHGAMPRRTFMETRTLTAGVETAFQQVNAQMMPSK